MKHFFLFIIFTFSFQSWAQFVPYATCHTSTICTNGTAQCGIQSGKPGFCGLNHSNDKYLTCIAKGNVDEAKYICCDNQGNATTYNKVSDAKLACEGIQVKSEHEKI